MKLNKRIEKILDDNNVSYTIIEQKELASGKLRIIAECEYCTDAHGYDFLFNVELGDDPKRINDAFRSGVFKLYQDFDGEEEMMPWIEKRGENGAPSSIREILRDGDECEKLLEKLFEAL